MAEQSWLYLYKMENVWFERCEQRLASHPDTSRWYVSEEVGNIRINAGYLQSMEDSAFPPANGSAWAWFVLHYYGWFGNAWPSHPDLDRIEYVDDFKEEQSESTLDIGRGVVKGRICNDVPHFSLFPSPPEYKATVLHSCR